MSADFYGNPYIATYWRNINNKTPQYRIVWHNGKNGKLVSFLIDPLHLL